MNSTEVGSDEIRWKMESFDQDSETESEEGSQMSFEPLDSVHSYSVCHIPPALEVIPNQYIDTFIGGSGKSILRVSKQEKYGAPQEGHINTRHVSGKKIGKKHAQFALSVGIMIGIRECVGGANSATEEMELLGPSGNEHGGKTSLEEECSRIAKHKFPAGMPFAQGIELPYKYKFKAYAPMVFSKIRSLAGVNKQRFLHSICGKDSFIEFVSNAKSGQFFFYSHDGRYMIKTQTKEEKTFLKQILPKYYTHLKENPHSFLTHFYGMYRVKIPELGKSIHFVIMKSVFNTVEEIHKIWDLKGSTHGRRSKRGDGVHKDLDIVEEGRKIHVGPDVKKAMTEQLVKDAGLLASLQIMDYSLLLGVHLRTEKTTIPNVEDARRQRLMRTNTPLRRQQLQQTVVIEKESLTQFVNEAAEQSLRTTGAVFGDDNSVVSDDSSTDGVDLDALKDVEDRQDHDDTISSWLSTSSTFDSTRPPCPYSSREDFGIESSKSLNREIYFAGIIDILQFYNARKWGETIIKKAAGNSEQTISCVNPDVYAHRFVEFIDNLLE